MTVPFVADQEIAELYAPVPVTVAEHATEAVGRIEVDGQLTVTAVTATGTATITTVEPDFVVSCVDIAVIVADPAAADMNTPAAEMVPLVADHVTAEL